MMYSSSAVMPARGTRATLNSRTCTVAEAAPKGKDVRAVNNRLSGTVMASITTLATALPAMAEADAPATGKFGITLPKTPQFDFSPFTDKLPDLDDLKERMPDMSRMKDLLPDAEDIAALKDILPDAEDVAAFKQRMPDMSAMKEMIPDAADMEALKQRMPDMSAMKEMIPGAEDIAAFKQRMPDMSAMRDMIPDAEDMAALKRKMPDMSSMKEKMPDMSSMKERMPDVSSMKEMIPDSKDLQGMLEKLPDVGDVKEMMPDVLGMASKMPAAANMKEMMTKFKLPSFDTVAFVHQITDVLPESIRPDHTAVDAYVARMIAVSNEVVVAAQAKPEISAAAGVAIVACLIYVFRPREVSFKEEGGSVIVSYKKSDGSRGKAAIKETRTGERVFSFKGDDASQ